VPWNQMESRWLLWIKASKRVEGKMRASSSASKESPQGRIQKRTKEIHELGAGYIFNEAQKRCNLTLMGEF
ncbi:hypothetical protein HAX54_052348, partial [Datura stramonium]|nr:hypothetical protein [Datura stramonium]